jgi:TPR repeat protein
MRRIAEAQRAYHEVQYSRSLVLFKSLAAQHNAEAAECAGFMLLMGEPMYGSQVRRNVERAKELLVQAAAAGRTGAGFLLNMVERTD